MMDMTRLIFIITTAALCLTHLTTATDVEDPCKQAEPEDRKSCFEDRNLALTDMPQNLDPLNPLYAVLESTLTMMDPSVHCQDPTKYREAARCAVNVSKTCHDPNGTKQVIMNADDVIAGMQVLCDRRTEVEMECFKTFYMMVMECSNYHRARNPLTVPDNMPIICANDDLMYDCMEVLMTPMCGANTTRVFLEQMDKYTVTPICVNGSNPARQRSRYFASLEPHNTTTTSAPCEQKCNNGVTTLPTLALLLTLVTMAAGVVISI